MEGVSESFMCLIALEKEASRRDSLRSQLRMETRHSSFGLTKTDKFSEKLRAKSVDTVRTPPESSP